MSKKKGEVVSIHTSGTERVIKAFRYDDLLTHNEMVFRAKLGIGEADKVISGMLRSGDLIRVGQYPNRFYACPAAKREV